MKAIIESEMEPLMTVTEVAKLLQVSPTFVRQHSNGLRKKPTIPSIKLGGAVRFRRESVLEFIRSMERS